jgi:hypothetical protein
MDAEREFGEAIVGWHPASSASTLVETLIGEWNLFTGGRPPEDDVSIAVIARR